MQGLADFFKRKAESPTFTPEKIYASPPLPVPDAAPRTIRGLMDEGTVQQPMVSPSPFCVERNDAHLVAVVGVFTVDDRYLLRGVHRATWMAPALQHPTVRGSAVARFVARAAGAQLPALQREAREHGDVTFLNASVHAPRSTGPLLSLVAWWACAQLAWPGAMHIGKADDDVWIDLPRIGAHLHSTHAVLREQNASPRIYWGLMEKCARTDGRTDGWTDGVAQRRRAASTARHLDARGWAALGRRTRVPQPAGPRQAARVSS